MSDDQVSQWIGQLAQGDQRAAQRIWDRYYGQLVRLARRKLGESRRRAADEEDVVLSAFNSFCRGARAGRFPQLDDREDLWKLLVTITARKAVAQLRRDHAQKRGGGQIRGESAFQDMGAEEERDAAIGHVLGREPTPEFAAMVAEECERLLSCLDEESLRQIAFLKLEGHTNVGIAQRLGCARATVERRVRRIQRMWRQVMSDEA